MANGVITQTTDGFYICYDEYDRTWTVSHAFLVGVHFDSKRDAVKFLDSDEARAAVARLAQEVSA